MKAFLDWSIRGKLIGMFMVMAIVSALSMSLPMGILELVGLRQTAVQSLSSLADAVARNSTASVAFKDSHTARDVLEALRGEPRITAACIYDKDGKPLAKYLRHDNPGEIPSVAQPVGYVFESGRLKVFSTILLDGEKIGTVFVDTDLTRTHALLREFFFAGVFALFITMLLALLLSLQLQRPISRPLGALVKIAKAISSGNDYSIRAAVNSKDEFGAIFTAFNDMVAQIERRDQELRHRRLKLEEEVEVRTEELLLANKQIRRAEEKYRAIFEDAVIGIFQTTPYGRPISINRAFAQIFGYESPESLMADPPDLSTFCSYEQLEAVGSAVQRDGMVRDAEVEMICNNGTKKWILVNVRAVKNGEGAVELLEGTIEDISHRKKAEEQIHTLAYYDALTGLPNRRLLRDRLEKALASARRRKEHVALLFLDLDRFKIINDSLGHSTGDLLLKEAAERLRHWGREQDTIARIGGDEFLIVITGLNDTTDVAVVAESLMKLIAADFEIKDRRFNISCSIGISIYPEHGENSETLIKNADAAMYRAKEDGRSAFRIFTDDINAEVMERLMMEHSLRLALKQKELFLMYQPQIDISTHRIVGAEALIRWKHPELGVVAPGRFIRVAENSGLILPIGEWILRTACAAAQKWQSAGMSNVSVAVNVSAVQFRQDGFANLIRNVLDETGLSPQLLELELTEGILLSHADLSVNCLRELRAMGIKMAIDDFGTGYSSLSYLRQFPVEKLKIDRSFIQSVAENPDDAAITEAIISMGKSLNLKVIAEGVETDAQLAFLKTHCCDEVQGYYFSKPLSIDDLLVQFGSVKATDYSLKSGK